MSRIGRTSLIHGCLLGLLSLTISISYATRSTPESRSMPAGSRAVGSSAIRFLNPSAGGVFDLGDAAVGTFVTRYISAAGGLPPYQFTTPDLIPPAIPPGSSLRLDPGGTLTGNLVTGIAPGPLPINITVSDSTYNPTKTLTSPFRLTIVAAPAATFRFAMDRINNGVLGASYKAKLDVIGGKGNVRFTVAPSTSASVLVNGVPKTAPGVTSLESIGLTLAEDGTISGRPLEVGTISFIARATDSINRTALNRANAAQDQIVTFSVEDNRTNTSLFTVTGCVIRGEVGKVNRDSVQLRALFSGGIHPYISRNPLYDPVNDPESLATFSLLRGTKFSLQVGAANFDGFFDVGGNFVNQRGGTLVLADGTVLTGSINLVGGILTASIQSATLGLLLDAANLEHRGAKRIAVSLVLNGQFNPTADPPIIFGMQGSDLIEFSTTHVRDRYGLDYRLGKIGTPIAGGFHVISVAGKDGTNNAAEFATGWTAKFISIPRFGLDAGAGLDGIDNVTVKIGTGFSETIPKNQLVSSKGGNVQMRKPLTKSEQVSKFTLNPGSFLGSVSTYPITERLTGLPLASPDPAGNPRPNQAIKLNFGLGISIDRSGTNADFFGEGVREIISVPIKAQWSDNARAQ